MFKVTFLRSKQEVEYSNKKTIQFKKSNMMNNLINIPGLNHIAIKIFENLCDKDLKSCTVVDELWKILIESQKFYWERFITRKIEDLRQHSHIT